MLANRAHLNLSVDGKVARVASTIPAYDRPRDRRVILIHGYNTSESKAIVSMGVFRAILGTFFPPLKHDVFTATWPGHSVLNFADYPFTIPRAQQSAIPLLREIFYRYATPGSAELAIVAHSLGCRVVLELLRRLTRRGRPPGLRRLTVILMAPAVPAFMAESGGRLAAGLAAADAIFVLHSRGDWVLGGPLSAFRLGQTIAGEGRFPEAIGSHGRPFAEAVRRDMKPAGHNDYWNNSDAAEVVCRALGIPAVAAALAKPAPMAPPLPLAPELTSFVLRMG